MTIAPSIAQPEAELSKHLWLATMETSLKPALLEIIVGLEREGQNNESVVWQISMGGPSNADERVWWNNTVVPKVHLCYLAF